MMTLIITAAVSFAAPARAQQPPRAGAAPAANTAPPKPNDYSDPKTWLCRPSGKDACAIDKTTTIVATNGKLTRETWSADPKAPIDYFYVYPTISTDPTP